MPWYKGEWYPTVRYARKLYTKKGKWVRKSQYGNWGSIRYNPNTYDAGPTGAYYRFGRRKHKKNRKTFRSKRK